MTETASGDRVDEEAEENGKITIEAFSGLALHRHPRERLSCSCCSPVALMKRLHRHHRVAVWRERVGRSVGAGAAVEGRDGDARRSLRFLAADAVCEALAPRL